jgi:predicted nuclease with RNAse H fold
MKIMSIDLAGKEGNPTGICILNNRDLFLETLFSNYEILDEVSLVDPVLVGIDAPLSLPLGRCCLKRECECAVGGHFRQAERDIRQYGRVLPLTFPGMNMLTYRGVKLGKQLRVLSDVFETHPRTNQRILGFTDLEVDLNRYFSIRGEVTDHTLDAALAALIGYFKLVNCCLELGDPVEGTIVIPRDRECLNLL